MDQWIAVTKEAAKFDVVGTPFNVTHETHVDFDPAQGNNKQITFLTFFLFFLFFIACFVCFLFFSQDLLGFRPSGRPCLSLLLFRWTSKQQIRRRCSLCSRQWQKQELSQTLNSTLNLNSNSNNQTLKSLFNLQLNRQVVQHLQ